MEPRSIGFTDAALGRGEPTAKPQRILRIPFPGSSAQAPTGAIQFQDDWPGPTLEGRMRVDGEWAGRVTGVRGQRVEIAMMRSPNSSASRLRERIP